MKIKLITTVICITILDFILLFFSKDILGDSTYRLVIRDTILTSFYFLTSLTCSSVILLFFNDKIFGLWLKKFMIWFVPVSVVLIATGSVEVNYGWPTRASMAINLGVIMFATTLIFALVQHFYYKTK